MTKLIFRYSRIYNETLASMAGKTVAASEHDAGQAFTSTFSAAWNTHNDELFTHYQALGLTLPSFWLAYPVHPQSTPVPFSDPLTFFISDQTDQAMATVIHELCHVFFGFAGNRDAAARYWQATQLNFPDLERPEQEHVLIHVLAVSGYFRVFSVQQVQALVAWESSLTTLVPSWKALHQRLPGGLENLRDPRAFLKV